MQDFRADDLYLHRVISGIAAHAGSDHAVLTLKRADRRKDGYRTSLWTWKGDERRIAVRSKESPSSVQLSLDGTRYAYLSKQRRGEQQVRVRSFDGGEPRDVGEATSEWQSILHWAPDGRRLLLTRKVAWKEDELDDPSGGDTRPRVANHLPYKQDGGGIRAGYRTQLDALEIASGTRQTLVQGDFDVQQAQWSPDGTRLAYVRTRGGMQRHWTELWLADHDGGQARRVVSTLPGINMLSWSPDGRRIALSAGALEGDALSYLYVFDVERGQVRGATSEELHLEAGAPQWHADNRRVAVIASVRGLHEVCVVDVESGQVQRQHRGLRHVASLKALGDGLAFSAASLRQAEEFFSTDWGGTHSRRRSRYNRRWFTQRNRPHVAKRRFPVPDGRGGQETIDAWVLTPAQGPGPWPVYVDMHGGPHSGALIDLSSHLYWYLLLSRGWMVVAPNAVGSSGYGDDFARRLRGRWGKLDLPQFLAVLRGVRERGWGSREQCACGGKSYGGFLAAWAAGHCEDFDAIVISAPVADVESHFGTSDSGYYVTPYAMDGEMQDHRERYHRLSPVQDIARSCASILLLQGEEDQRCPLDQSEELFAALIRAGTPAKLVVYPGGSHSMAGTGKPSHRLDYHRRIEHFVQRALHRASPVVQGGERKGDADAKEDSDVPASNKDETGAAERQVQSGAKRER